MRPQPPPHSSRTSTTMRPSKSRQRRRQRGCCPTAALSAGWPASWEVALPRCRAPRRQTSSAPLDGGARALGGRPTRLTHACVAPAAGIQPEFSLWDTGGGGPRVTNGISGNLGLGQSGSEAPSGAEATCRRQMKAPPSTVCSSLRHFGQVQPNVEPCPGFCGASPPSAHKRFSPVAPCPGVSCPCGTCLDGPDFERCVPEHHLGWSSRPGSVAAEAGAMTRTRSRERVAGCREPCRSSAPPPLNCRPSGHS